MRALEVEMAKAVVELDKLEVMEGKAIGLSLHYLDDVDKWYAIHPMTVGAFNEQGGKWEEVWRLVKQRDT